MQRKCPIFSPAQLKVCINRELAQHRALSKITDKYNFNDRNYSQTHVM